MASFDRLAQACNSINFFDCIERVCVEKGGRFREPDSRKLTEDSVFITSALGIITTFINGFHTWLVHSPQSLFYQRVPISVGELKVGLARIAVTSFPSLCFPPPSPEPAPKPAKARKNKVTVTLHAFVPAAVSIAVAGGLYLLGRAGWVGRLSAISAAGVLASAGEARASEGAQNIQVYASEEEYNRIGFWHLLYAEACEKILVPLLE